MKIIGLTGSIGMGKTETSNMFRNASIPVFDSDAGVHDLLGIGGDAVDEIEKNFAGVKVDNYIDRQKLGGKVFGDNEALSKLENILHPMVRAMRENFVVENHNNDIVLFDIPLLFEKGYENVCDYVVVVTAPAEVQSDRVLARPGMDEKRFADILFQQMPDEEKREKADFIIQTDQGFEYAKTQVLKIINQVRKDINA
jgi:dephospho-CoA kinase